MRKLNQEQKQMIIKYTKLKDMKNLIKCLHNTLYLVLCVVFVSCSSGQMKEEYNEKSQKEYSNSYEYRANQCSYIITVWGVSFRCYASVRI